MGDEKCNMRCRTTIRLVQRPGDTSERNQFRMALRQCNRLRQNAGRNCPFQDPLDPRERHNMLLLVRTRAVSLGRDSRSWQGVANPEFEIAADNIVVADIPPDYRR